MLPPCGVLCDSLLIGYDVYTWGATTPGNGRLSAHVMSLQYTVVEYKIHLGVLETGMFDVDHAAIPMQDAILFRQTLSPFRGVPPHAREYMLHIIS